MYDLGGSVAEVLDANVVVFNNAFSNAVNADDAIKLFNSSENFAIKRDGRLLVVEGRQAIVEYDTVYFELWNLLIKQYTFEFNARFANAPGLTAHLVDRYLGNSRPLRINDTTRIQFTCDANPGSRARDRFRVIFRKPSNSLPVRFLSVSANRENRQAVIGWQVDGERGVSHYEVESSFNGRDFNRAGRVEVHTGYSIAVRSYTWSQFTETDRVTYYRVRNLDFSGAYTYSPVVRLDGLKSTRGALIYPNPVRGNTMQLRLTNPVRENYQLEWISSQGSVIHFSAISHPGGQAEHVLRTPGSIPPGIYCLKLIGGGEVKVFSGVQFLP